jgi:hypothetical protein
MFSTQLENTYSMLNHRSPAMLYFKQSHTHPCEYSETHYCTFNKKSPKIAKWTGIRNDHLNGSLKNEAKTRTWENLRMADANSILPLSAFKLKSLYSRSVNSKYGNQRKKTKKQKNGQTG